jgi:hypothetical protein
MNAREQNPTQLKQRRNEVQIPVNHLARATRSQIQPTITVTRAETKTILKVEVPTSAEKICVRLNRKIQASPPNPDRKIVDMAVNS